MKFLWFFGFWLCAFLFLHTIEAELHDSTQLEIVGVKTSESKLLNEVDDRGDDEALEDENNDDGGSIFPEILTDKDVEHIKEPGMQRLARHLKSFHNYNVQRSNNNLDFPEEDDDVEPEERAIRRRQRIRRRNIKNKIKPGNRNRQVANRRNGSRRRMENKQNVRRFSTKRSKVKNTKKTRRNNTRRSVVRNRNGKRSQKRGNLGTGNMKRKRSNKRRRNNGQKKVRGSENEEVMHNSGETINESDLNAQTPEKETAIALET